MVGIIFYGLYQSSNNKTINDFFLADNNISWITAMFSIVATETSVLTFISIPGIAYRGDWTFIQLAIGYIFGRILVSIILLPIFFKQGITSIYELLEKHFNKNIQKLGSITFLTTRVLADGVRFLATAIILQSITGWSIYESIFIIGAITLIYTVSGGLRAVIHIDAFQFIIYLSSAIICIYFLFLSIDNTIYESMSFIYNSGKIKVFNFSDNFLKNPFAFVSAFIGGTMLSFASHGSDYMMVQRVLATKDIKSARKAMIGSGIFVLFQFLLFLFIGSLIYIVSDCIMLEKDREISYVINNVLPVGFKGIVIAGVLSAAMSTLSSSINSLSSSTIRDWFPNITSVKISRFVAVGWTIILISSAIIFNNADNALVIVGLKIASFTYGVLLSFFILVKLGKFKTENIIIGYIAGILTVFILSYMGIAWTFYILGSIIANVFVVLLLEKFKQINFLKDLLLFSLSICFIFIFFIKDVSKQSTNIIDINVKQMCTDDKNWLGSDIMIRSQSNFKDLNNVGLVINHTSHIVSIDNLHNKIKSNIPNLNIRVIFTPEHGLENNYEAGESVSNDNTYNVPIISLYGEKHYPDIKLLKNLDAIIFDIQDIGSRYYTYISTMTNMMNACAEAGIKFYVLDRPNPISGLVNGPLLKKDFSSFVGMHEIPIRHGMTIGELAYMINEENWLNSKVDLHIVKMKGWKRNYYNSTGLNFIPPSPNIPDLETAIIYSGLCLIEGTNLSEGRGTDKPFKLIGAPWFNVDDFLEEFNMNIHQGIQIEKTTFIPRKIKGKSNYPKYENIECNGIKINITNMNKARPLEFSIYLINAIYASHKKYFKFNSNNFIDKLYGSDQLRLYVLNELNIQELINSWEKFDNSKYLIY